MRRPLLRLFPALLLNLTAFGIAVPVIPALVRAAGGGATEIGWLFAVQTLGQLIAAPAWGRLSDRFGRGPVLIATLLAAAAADALTSSASGLLWLFVARFLAGLAAGNVATATAYVADHTDASRRAGGMALVGICFGLGFTIGPLIGAWAAAAAPDGLGSLGRGFPFVVAAAVNIAAALVAAALIREAGGGAQARRAVRGARSLKGTRASLLRRPGIRPLAALLAIYSIAVTLMETSFYVYMEERFGYDEAEVGLFFGAMGIVGVVVQGGVGRWARTFGERPVAIVGGLGLAAGVALATGVGGLVWLSAMFAIAAAGRALFQPAAMGLISAQSSGPEESGRVMALAQAALSAGRLMGYAVGGVIYDQIAREAPFLFAGALLGAAVLAWAALGRRRDTMPQGRPAELTP